MERILMPKMLELFQKISEICQKVLEKSSGKNANEAKTIKAVIELKKEFESLASEVSFNDTLINEISENRVITAHTYCLFYRKKNKD